jgi:hypothetical protein
MDVFCGAGNPHGEKVVTHQSVDYTAMSSVRDGLTKERTIRGGNSGCLLGFTFFVEGDSAGSCDGARGNAFSQASAKKEGSVRTSYTR